jgi:predicted lipid-binding transport protein (Tim44 family)
MVAAFLGFWLFSILGKRTGHEQEPMARPLEEPRQPQPQARLSVEGRDAQPSPPQLLSDGPVDAGLRAIAAADRSFDAAHFIEGAREAYRMVLEAYWRGDRDELAFLADDAVAADFVAAIEAREARGETLENRLVRIESARIVDADYAAPNARVTVRFDADIAALVRGADGAVIGGSLSDAVETHDVWTFARDVKSRDPNWKLVETDEA